jgi:tripartite ATP-independent transporter DctP family solute receptor
MVESIRKTVAASMMLFGLCLTLLGVTSNVLAAEKLELKLGHVATLDNAYHLGAQRFADILAERSKGQVAIKIFPNAQLGNERDLVEGLQLGTVQAVVSANAPLSRYTEKVLLFDLPFLFRDDAHWDKVVDGPLGQSIAAELASFGFRTVGYFDGGWRSPYNSKRPIASIDDLRGMKFRTMESPMHIAIYKALGAQGVPMASSEQYSALEQGVVDGSDAPISFYSQLRHYEVAKHLSSLPLFKLTVHLLVSEKTFQSLTPDQQQMVLQAGREAASYQRVKAREIDAKLRNELEMKGGVRVSQLKDSDRDKFVEAMRKTVWAEYGQRVGQDRIQTVVDTR